MSEQNEKSLGEIAYEADTSVDASWGLLHYTTRNRYRAVAAAIEKEVLRRNGIAPKLPGQRAYEIYYKVFAPEARVQFAQQLEIVQKAFAAVERDLTKQDEPDTK